MIDDIIIAVKKYQPELIIVENKKTTILNQKVNAVYVINLKEDERKRNYIIKLMQKYSINFTLVIVNKVDPIFHKELCKKHNSQITVGELGCCLSHMWCLSHIVYNKFNNAIIFEDDVILHKEFISKFISIYENNKNIDFLMFGAHDYNFPKLNHTNVINGIYKPNSKSEKLYGAHANYYSLKGAIRMFYTRATKLSFFDNEYMLLFNTMEKSYVCYPNLAISNINDSSLNHKKDFLSLNETNYYESCFVDFKFTDYNYLTINILNKKSLNNCKSYDEFIENCLYYLFHDLDKIKTVKNRFVIDFFNLNDVKYILSCHNKIHPNKRSKK